MATESTPFQTLDFCQQVHIKAHGAGLARRENTPRGTGLAICPSPFLGVVTGVVPYCISTFRPDFDKGPITLSSVSLSPYFPDAFGPNSGKAVFTAPGPGSSPSDRPLVLVTDDTNACVHAVRIWPQITHLGAVADFLDEFMPTSIVCKGTVLAVLCSRGDATRINVFTGSRASWVRTRVITKPPIPSPSINEFRIRGLTVTCVPEFPGPVIVCAFGPTLVFLCPVTGTPLKVQPLTTSYSVLSMPTRKLISSTYVERMDGGWLFYAESSCLPGFVGIQDSGSVSLPLLCRGDSSAWAHSLARVSDNATVLMRMGRDSTFTVIGNDAWRRQSNMSPLSVAWMGAVVRGVFRRKAAAQARTGPPSRRTKVAKTKP